MYACMYLHRRGKKNGKGRKRVGTREEERKGQERMRKRKECTVRDVKIENVKSVLAQLNQPSWFPAPSFSSLRSIRIAL